MNDQTYTLEFEGRAGDDRDVYIQTVIRDAGGEVTAAGTFLASPPQRDIQFIVPADRVEMLTMKLALVGVTPRAKEVAS